MVVYGIVYSTGDPAGYGVARLLVELLGLEKCGLCRDCIECFCGRDIVLAGFKEDAIYFDFLDDRLSVDKYIVLSRHSSMARVKSYTVHHTGNPGPEARYGGKPYSLAVASPPVTYGLLQLLVEKAREYGREKEYDVSYEATHHGPTEPSKPLTFIEIGSSIEEWRDHVNHRVLAEAVTCFLERREPSCKPVVGVGGGHYPRKHTRYALENNVCYGHIFAKYSLPYLGIELLEKALNRSVPKPRAVVVEKKGTRREHRELIEEFTRSYSVELEYI